VGKQKRIVSIISLQAFSRILRSISMDKPFPQNQRSGLFSF